MEIGHRIAAARVLAGLSQRALAAAVKVSPGLVGQWESHKKKPGRENLRKIAQVCTVSQEYLNGDEPISEFRLQLTDPEEIAFIRQFRRLNPLQRQNLRQLLGITIEIREEIEKERSPAEGQDVS